MTTAIIGTGNVGSALARHLANGGETVVLAARDQSKAQALAQELGPRARAASVRDAIAEVRDDRSRGRNRQLLACDLEDERLERVERRKLVHPRPGPEVGPSVDQVGEYRIRVVEELTSRGIGERCGHSWILPVKSVCNTAPRPSRTSAT